MNRPRRCAAFSLGLVICGGIAAQAFATGAILNKSGPIQITANGQFVWAVNPDHNSISRLRTSDNSVTQFPLPNIGEPHNPRALAITPNGGEVWVAAHDSNRVYVLNANTGAVLSVIVLHHGSGPISIAIAPDGTRALVALHRSAEIAVLDTLNRAIVKIIPVYPHPLGIAYVSTPNRAWVSHMQLDGEHSFVTAIDTAGNAVAARVFMGSTDPKFLAQIPGDPDPIPEGGYIFLHGHIAQAPGSNFLWLPAQYQNFHTTVFTPNSSIQSALHKIDLNANTTNPDNRVVFTAVYAHRNNNTLVGDGWNAKVSGPEDIAFNAAGTTAYLVHAYSNDVLVFPTNLTINRPAGANPLTEINVGAHPIGLTVSPTANKIYVLNYLSRDISVINQTTLLEEARVPATPGAPEPKPAEFLLGQKIFNASVDPRVSANQKIACASCHPDGGTDGLRWGFAQFGAGSRKTLHLRGLSLAFGPQANGRGQLHRSGDRDEVQDFDDTFRNGIMGGTGFLASPNPPLGPPNAGRNAELDALAAYALGLPPLKKSPARAADGSLTEAATRGGALYRNNSGGRYDVRCGACHVSPTFTDLGFHDVGGLMTPPENEGPLFNTPSLVGAWDVGPYHQVIGFARDGESLGGIVRKAVDGVHGNTSGLSATQMRDLSAFLNSIDGDLANTGINNLADTSPPRIVAVQPISLNLVDVVFNETVDAATAGDPNNYALFDGVKTLVPTAVTVDTARGNHVRLTVALEFYGCPVTYTLRPGPIADVAGAVGGGANNVLDVHDPANQKSFTFDGLITVTFGDLTGNETFSSVAHDAAFESGNPNFSHTHLKLVPTANPETKGFVSFDFAPALANVCGVTDAAQIVEARFAGLPQFGARNTLELRRCFLPWGEPPNDFCISCPGMVTRSHAKWQTLPWRQSGAAARGGNGTNPGEYYPTAAFDVALAVDATVAIPDMAQRVEFAGPLVTDAFRFWFANPTKNFGYSVEVAGASGPPVDFYAAEAEGGQNGFVLSVTFAVPPLTNFPDCNHNGVADPCDIAGATSADANHNGLPDECEPPVVRGDLNCDGVADFFDFDPFILALTDPAGYAAAHPDCDPLRGDLNGDEVLDFFDVDPFVACVLNGGC